MKHLLSALFIGCLSSPVAAQTWNLRTSPLGLIGGEANLRLDYSLAEAWMLGAEVGVIDRRINGVELKAMGVGLFTTYLFNGVFQSGPYLDLGVLRAHERAHENSTGHSATYDNTSVRLLGGYHWFWNVINLSLGAGLASNSAGRVILRDGQGQEVDHMDVAPIRLAVDFSLGLAW